MNKSFIQFILLKDIYTTLIKNHWQVGLEENMEKI